MNFLEDRSEYTLRGIKWLTTREGIEGTPDVFMTAKEASRLPQLEGGTINLIGKAI